MDIGKVKYLALAIGVIASVAFYVYEGDFLNSSEAATIVFGESENKSKEDDTSVNETASSDNEKIDGEASSQTGESSLWSEENIKELFKSAMQEEITTIVREAVKNELVSLCEAGYLEQALEETAVYVATQAEAKKDMININTADVDTLTTLTGIGESRAKDIISYREANGGFKSIEEIMNVSGIGEATFAKFKDKIYV